nr:hypothetical protein GCM10020185_60810 [Pseudomonas brassicacearum subsp. brassicacearum]
MQVQRLLQQLLQRQDHTLLAQLQGLVLIQVPGHGQRTERQQRQRPSTMGAQIKLHYVS